MTPTIDRPSVPTTRELYRFTADQRRRMVAAGIATANPLGVNGEPIPVRLTGEEYDRIVELGILTEQDEVELIHGEVLVKMARNDPHDESVEFLTRLLVRLLPDELSVRCQSAVRPEGSSPEPDFVVCPPRRRRRRGHPIPGEMLLVIEVADSSLADDRGWKAELYAAAGVPQYWVVNVRQRQIEVYTQPGESGYGTRTDYLDGQNMPLTVAGVPYGTIPVTAVMPLSGDPDE